MAFGSTHTSVIIILVKVSGLMSNTLEIILTKNNINVTMKLIKDMSGG